MRNQHRPQAAATPCLCRARRAESLHLPTL